MTYINLWDLVNICGIIKEENNSTRQQELISNYQDELSFDNRMELIKTVAVEWPDVYQLAEKDTMANEYDYFEDVVSDMAWNCIERLVRSKHI